MAGVRRVVGQCPGARLRGDTPRPGDRAGAARHLHPAARGAGLLLQRRRRPAVPGPLRAFPRAARAVRDFAGDAIAAYHDLLFDPDPAVHGPAAVAWSTWEAATITLEPDAELIATFAEPAYALAFARIENHYFVHAGWLTEGQLIADAHRLRDIPGVIVQGRYDVATPAVTAWDLHRAWPAADLQLVGDAGHAYSEPGITRALVAATDRFAASLMAEVAEVPDDGRGNRAAWQRAAEKYVREHDELLAEAAAGGSLTAVELRGPGTAAPDRATGGAPAERTRPRRRGPGSGRCPAGGGRRLQLGDHRGSRSAGGRARVVLRVRGRRGPTRAAGRRVCRAASTPARAG